MQLKIYRNHIRWLLSSALFPLIVASFAFVTWALPGNYAYITAVLYALLCFLPLLDKNGKPYISLVLFASILSDEQLLLTDIQGELLLVSFALVISAIIHLIIYKKSFCLTEGFYVLIVLISVFVISYIFNMITDDKESIHGILHLLLMYGMLIVCSFLTTMVDREEILPYFCNVVIIFSIVIVTEIYATLLAHKANPFDFPSLMLGWSDDNSTANALLCLSLPFYAIQISKKKILWLLGMFYVFSGILVLSTASGLLCVLLGIIPLIFLTFRGYGKNYPYLVLACLIVAIGTIALLMGFNKTANENILNAIKSINLALDIPSGRKEAFESAIKEFVNSPILGISTASMVDSNGTMMFVGNTILTTLLFGGSIGLIAFVIMEIRMYYIVLKRKCPERLFVLLFLLFLEILGLGSNTIYSIPIFLFFIMTITIYSNSNRPMDMIIHDSDFTQNTIL